MKLFDAAIKRMKASECEGVDPYALAVDVTWMVGCAVAGFISTTLQHPAGWVLVHVLLSWIYVIYAGLHWAILGTAP